MANQHLGVLPSQQPNVNDHGSILALLPEYITILVLGQAPPGEWLPLERHLGQCAACRGEADALYSLMKAYYTGTISDAIPPKPPDLSFLKQPMNRQRTPQRLFQAQLKQPRFSFQFSSAVLFQMTARADPQPDGFHLRYAYEIPPKDATDLAVTIEIFSHEMTSQHGFVRICVEQPERNPFDQAGTYVELHAGELYLSAVSDQNGVVTFVDVLLEQIAEWRIIATPPETP